MDTKIDKLKAWGSRHRETIGKVVVGVGATAIVAAAALFVAKQDRKYKPRHDTNTLEIQQAEIDELRAFADLLQEELDAS